MSSVTSFILPTLWHPEPKGLRFNLELILLKHIQLQNFSEPNEAFTETSSDLNFSLCSILLPFLLVHRCWSQEHSLINPCTLILFQSLLPWRTPSMTPHFNCLLGSSTKWGYKWRKRKPLVSGNRRTVIKEEQWNPQDNGKRR